VEIRLLGAPLSAQSSLVVAGVFVPGLRLSRAFYGGVVRPLLDERFPGLPHSAALIGPGSEVLGFDSERSTDHDWGPRLQVFLHDEDAARLAVEITRMLATRLPETFRGFDTKFPPSGEHRVEVTGLGVWLESALGFDPRSGVSLTQWLATPTQRLAEVTGGGVFHDGPGELTRARKVLAWYPDDVWFYMLACQWARISQEESFPGRCAEIRDELGSVLLAARLVRDLMRLCLLMYRRYPPYGKWLGAAFGQLPTGPAIGAHLSAVMAAPDWPSRERHLCDSYTAIATLHNDLGLTDRLDPATTPYHGRPHQVLAAGRFTDALLARIADPAIRRLPLVGGVAQFIDSTDALGKREITTAAAAAAVQMACTD
jgi:hypothetical protein